MVSRENRVLLASTSTVLVVLVVLVVVAVTGVGGESAALGAFVFAGLGVLAPQLYLAATDDDVDPETRVRVGVLVTIFLLWGALSTADGGAKPVIAGACLALFVALVGYEFWTGYRDTTA